MAQTEREIADCVGAIYEASTGGGDWHQVGDRLRRLTNARRAILRVPDGNGSSRNLLMNVDEGDAVYAAYYHSIDPYTSRARRDFSEERSGHLGRARIGAEIVAEDAFLRSEYYVDFARRHARRHMLGGMVGVGQANPIGLFRDDTSQPFGAHDVRLLEILLPHLQRALELRERLGLVTEDACLTRAALDSVAAGMAIVDAGLKLHFLNEAGRRHLDHGASGLGSMRSGPYAGNGVYLAARSRQDAAQLRRLIAGSRRTQRVRGALEGRVPGPAADESRHRGSGHSLRINALEMGGERRNIRALVRQPGLRRNRTGLRSFRLYPGVSRSRRTGALPQSPAGRPSAR